MICNVKHGDYNTDNLFTWCTNCGNYGIHGALKEALKDECINPHEIVICFDIGCNGNGADKINAYTVHGLHGRVIPFACGASVANPTLPVIASGGDGGTLGEGINHLIAAVRADFNITFMLHNNFNYGLTTGQASPTSPEAIPMNSSPDGSTSSPIHVLDLIFSLSPTFVARGFSGNVRQLTTIMREAINHKGFSFIEILQDCPTYNKNTPHDWYLDKVYDINTTLNYNRADIDSARRISMDMSERIATGVLYQNEKGGFLTKLQNRAQLQDSPIVNEVKQYDPTVLFETYI